ncbi:MAG: hypothetical protein KatS3mg105_2037 [Gemmatales bacterium]|nr:MAG: hypothetical protein KatS3mg105_2037 [Gemmatales bacterium]
MQSQELKPNNETSIKAYEEYHDRGKVETVRCERCNDLLKIEPLGDSALKMSCTCGLYNGTFRGI